MYSAAQLNTLPGLIPYHDAALTNTKLQVTTGESNIFDYDFYNPGAAVTYVQVFDALIAAITLGTTAPLYVITIPPTGGRDRTSPVSQYHFTTGMAIAATTTPTGSTAPATALVATLFTR